MLVGGRILASKQQCHERRCRQLLTLTLPFFRSSLLFIFSLWLVFWPFEKSNWSTHTRSPVVVAIAIFCFGAPLTCAVYHRRVRTLSIWGLSWRWWTMSAAFSLPELATPASIVAEIDTPLKKQNATVAGLGFVTAARACQRCAASPRSWRKCHKFAAENATETMPETHEERWWFPSYGTSRRIQHIQGEPLQVELRGDSFNGTPGFCASRIPNEVVRYVDLP